MKDVNFYMKPENFYAFLKEVLRFGYERLEEKPHAEMCYFLAREDLKNKRMLAVPRGCFKTTILNGYVVWDICRNLYRDNYDFNYLLDSATKNLVLWNLRFIKRRLDNNEQLIRWFGEFKSKKYWGKEAIIIQQQEHLFGQQQRKEPTIMISSVESSIVGFHFKNIIADDWVTDKTIRTVYALERTKLHYKEIMNVKDGKGKLFMACTFWDSNDVYSEIIKNEQDDFSFMIKPIYEKTENGDYKLFFPKEYPLTRIMQLKKQLGSAFYPQYMLTPIPQDAKIFPDNKYQEIERKNIPLLTDVFIVYDPANLGSTNRSSLDCIAVIGMDANYNQYLLDLMVKEGARMDASTAIETIIYFAKKYDDKLRGILVEKILGSKFIRTLFENYCRKNNLRYTALYKEEAVDYERSKKDRIRILEVPWLNGQMWVCKDIPQEMRDEVREEFTTFDKCRYYDVLDCWAMAAKYFIFEKPAKKEEEIKKQSLFLLDDEGVKINAERLFEIGGGEWN